MTPAGAQRPSRSIKHVWYYNIRFAVFATTIFHGRNVCRYGSMSTSNERRRPMAVDIPHPTNDGKRPPPPRHGIVANCPSLSYYARRERDDGRYSRRAIVSRYRPLPPTHPTRGGTLGLPQRDTYIIRQHAPPRPTRRAESPPIILLFAERPPPFPRQKTDEAKRVRGDPSISSSSHPVETRQLPPRACSPFRAKDGV